FQRDRLRQPDKWLDAKQVGQDERFLRQEFVKGLHTCIYSPGCLFRRPGSLLTAAGRCRWLAGRPRRTRREQRDFPPSFFSTYPLVKISPPPGHPCAILPRKMLVLTFRSTLNSVIV